MAASTVALLWIGHAAQAETRVYVEPGASAATYAADQQRCADVAKAAHLDPNTGLPPEGAFASRPGGGYVYTSPQVGVAGAAVANVVLAAIGEAMLDGETERRLDQDCLASHGYVRIGLTPAEQAQFDALRDDRAKLAWIAQFASGDLAARIAAARADAAPALPLAANEPFTLGAVRLDPDGLKLATGPVAVGGAVLTGQVSHRRTAVLKQAMVSSFLNAKADAGTEFMQFASAIPWSDDFSAAETAWCGKLDPTGFSLRYWAKNPLYCFRADGRGYMVPAKTGEVWLPQTVGVVRLMAQNIPTLELEPQDHDGIGPLDFALVVTKLTATEAHVAANVIHDGKTVTVWSGAVSFDPSGQAIVPFWSRRLLLSRSGETVTAVWDAAGTGVGLTG